MKKIRIKAIRNISIPGENLNDISPEALREKIMAPGAVFEIEEGDEKGGAIKLINRGSAEETTQKVSTPQELEDLRVDHEQHLRKVEKARLKRIASENEG